MRATPLISATCASAAVFPLMKLAVMPIASFPLSSLCLKPESLEKKVQRTVWLINAWLIHYIQTLTPPRNSFHVSLVYSQQKAVSNGLVSPWGTNLPPPAEMKTSNWKAVAGWLWGCSLAIQPFTKTSNRHWMIWVSGGVMNDKSAIRWGQLLKGVPVSAVGSIKPWNSTSVCTSTPRRRHTFSRINCSWRMPENRILYYKNIQFVLLYIVYSYIVYMNILYIYCIFTRHCWI